MSTCAGSERRCAARYAINASVFWEYGDGLSENLSTAGLYFVTGKQLEPGQRIRLTLTLPRQLTVLAGEGVVLRVELQEGGYGVAVRLDSLMPAVSGEA